MACQAQPFVIVGGGRVGNALSQMGDGADKIVKRGEPVDGPDGPIIVCTRNDDLQGVIDMTPEARRQDLVFIQNGMLQPYLEKQGLGDNTQALIYFAVAKYGEAPTDGTTDANPEGLTSACGKHAGAIASRLQGAGLTCHELDDAAYRKAMIEKLAWICALMLVGERNGGITVGEVESSHREEVEPLLDELVKAGCADMGVPPKEGFTERLMAYSRSVAHFPTAVKELPWRNGFFVDLTKKAEGEGQRDPCPIHTKFMTEIGKT